MANGVIPSGVQLPECGGTGKTTVAEALYNISSRPKKFFTITAGYNRTLTFSASCRYAIFLSGTAAARQGIVLVYSSASTAYFVTVEASTGVTVTKSGATINIKSIYACGVTMICLSSNSYNTVTVGNEVKNT